MLTVILDTNNGKFIFHGIPLCNTVVKQKIKGTVFFTYNWSFFLLENGQLMLCNKVYSTGY